MTSSRGGWSHSLPFLHGEEAIHDVCIRYNQSHILRCFNCFQDTSCFAQAR